MIPVKFQTACQIARVIEILENEAHYCPKLHQDESCEEKERGANELYEISGILRQTLKDSGTSYDEIRFGESSGRDSNHIPLDEIPF